MKNKRFIALVLTIVLAVAASQALMVKHSHKQPLVRIEETTSKPTTPDQHPRQTSNYQDLAYKSFVSGSAPYITVNNNVAELSATDWHTEEIDYSPLDRLNRVGSATAYLSKRNLGSSESRIEQHWQPTGWHNQPVRVNGKRIFPQNRGHLIAYTLSFNFDQDGHYRSGEFGSLDNPKNLATQTAFSNQTTMQVFESQVRDALKHNKKVIYKVTPVFRDQELMPRGYWSQALSTDGTLNFNVYIWNVEPGISFDYATGRGHANRNERISNKI